MNIKALALAGIITAVALSPAASGETTAKALPDVATNDYLFGTAQNLTRLRARVTYQAARFRAG